MCFAVGALFPYFWHLKAIDFLQNHCRMLQLQDNGMWQAQELPFLEEGMKMGSTPSSEHFTPWTGWSSGPCQPRSSLNLPDRHGAHPSPGVMWDPGSSSDTVGEKTSLCQGTPLAAGGSLQLLWGLTAAAPKHHFQEL